jgi:hypothetical protein
MRITPSPPPAQGPQQLSRTERLARALIADRNREAASRADISECFVCGHGMLYRGSRFCSDRCREFYDTGAPGHLEDWRASRALFIATDCTDCPDLQCPGLRQRPVHAEPTSVCELPRKDASNDAREQGNSDFDRRCSAANSQ